MNHNLISAMLQEMALKNLAMLQMREFYSQFFASQPSEKPVTSVPVSEIHPIRGGAREMAWQAEEDAMILSFIKLHGPKN